MKLMSVVFLLNVVHGIFLALILCFNSVRKINANYFLIPLLLIITGYQTKAVIVLEGYYSTFPHAIKLFLPLHFLLGPLFFYYVRFTIGIQKKLKLKDSIHLLPFFICFFSLMPFYVLSGREKLAMHKAPSPDNFDMAIEMTFYYVPILFFALLYYWKSWKILQENRKSIDGRTSNELQKKLIWLEKYTSVFLLFIVCFTIAQLIFFFTDFYQFYVMLFTVFTSSVLIHYIAYWAIKQSRIINTVSISENVGYLSKGAVTDIKHMIEVILKDEQQYLNSDLSSKYFCDRLQINSMYLSKIVNREFQCNISFLINSYRVEHAKIILKSGELDHLNFGGIAEHIGFNSANAFTRVFKQHTAKTPSEYKKQIRQN